MKLPLLSNVKTEELTGKRVLLRVDFNVPVKNNAVADDFRIKKTLPTIKYLCSVGAKTVLISHAGKNESLRSVFRYLSRIFKLVFVAKLADLPEHQKKIRPGGLILLENIRNFAGETDNDDNFARRLAHRGDFFVNEAFSVSHRSHASVVGLPKFLRHFAAPLFAEEVEKLSEAFKPPHPSLFILGGAKFETKLPLIKKFRDNYDIVYLAGALANDLLKARGISVGLSARSADSDTLEFLRCADKLLAPSDVVVFGPSGAEQKPIGAISAADKIVDIGRTSATDLHRLVKRSKFILWNGTLGICEEGFAAGTQKLAAAIAASGARSIVGGGDTVAALDKKDLLERFSFVSTGGGAMLQFLADGTLPGIEALKI